MKYAVDFSGYLYIEGDDITSQEDAEKRFWEYVQNWKEVCCVEADCIECQE